MDLKIESSVKFGFGCTYAQVCAIKFATLTESVREFLPSTVCPYNHLTPFGHQQTFQVRST